MKNVSLAKLAVLTSAAFVLSFIAQSFCTSESAFFTVLIVGVLLFLPLLARVLIAYARLGSHSLQNKFLKPIIFLLLGLFLYALSVFMQCTEGRYVPDMNVGFVRILGIIVLLAGLVSTQKADQGR